MSHNWSLQTEIERRKKSSRYLKFGTSAFPQISRGNKQVCGDVADEVTTLLKLKSGREGLHSGIKISCRHGNAAAGKRGTQGVGRVGIHSAQ